MKRLSLAILIAGLVLLLAVSAALAFKGTTDRDTWFDATTQYPTQTSLNLTSSGTPDTCAPFSTGLVRFDISSIVGEPVANKTINSVVFTMTVAGTSAAWPGPVVLTLYPVSNDTWLEDDVTDARNAIVTATPLATVNLLTKPAIGTVLTFPGTPQFVAFLQSKSSATGGPGNNLVSLAVRMTTCATGNTTVRLASRRHATVAYRPFMELYNPNAVTLSTFRAANPAVNWPLIAAALLLVAAVAGFGVYRWRVSQVRAR